MVDLDVFLRKAMDPDIAPKLSPALLAAREALLRDSLPLSEVRKVMMEAGPITQDTASNMLRYLRKARMVLVTGRYDRKKCTDNRMVHIGEWS